MNTNQVNKFKNSIQPTAYICILAGDIGNPYKTTYKDFLSYTNSIFKKVFLIAGNHEYYKNSIYETKNYIKELISEFKNISFLDNSYEDYENYRFIGTTQWSEVTNTQYTINDIEYINNFNIDKYNKLYYEAKDFLETSIVPNSIVITHHLPLYELTYPKYRVGIMNKYNPMV